MGRSSHDLIVRQVLRPRLRKFRFKNLRRFISSSVIWDFLIIPIIDASKQFIKAIIMRILRGHFKNFFQLFENKKNRTLIVGFSFLLHALAGILMLKLSRDSAVSTFFQIAASFSIVPIILFAENFKKLSIYLLLIVSPMPFLIFLMSFLIMLMGIFQKGTSFLSIEKIEGLFFTPLLMSSMFLIIIWPYLLTAFGLRVLIRAYLKKTSEHNP